MNRRHSSCIAGPRPSESPCRMGRGTQAGHMVSGCGGGHRRGPMVAGPGGAEGAAFAPPCSHMGRTAWRQRQPQPQPQPQPPKQRRIGVLPGGSGSLPGSALTHARRPRARRLPLRSERGADRSERGPWGPLGARRVRAARGAAAGAPHASPPEVGPLWSHGGPTYHWRAVLLLPAGTGAARRPGRTCRRAAARPSPRNGRGGRRRAAAAAAGGGGVERWSRL